MRKSRKKESDEKNIQIFLKRFALVCLGSFIFLPLVDVTFILMFVLLIGLIMAYFIWRERLGREIFVAFLFALFITSYYTYEYKEANLMLGKINLFPLICWTAGLVFARNVYARIHTKYKFLMVYAIYLAVLFSLEYFGYHLLGVQLNSHYQGFLGLDIMHGPTGMKVFYLFAGPVYLLLTNYLRVK